MSNATCDLNEICKSINAAWKDSSSFKRELELVYANAGYRWEIDSSDQIYFLSALHTIVLSSSIRYIIQTGTHAGFSAISMALALRKKGVTGRIDTIDPEPPLYGQEVISDPVGIAKKVVRNCGLEDLIKFHKGYSVKPWDDGRMDLPEAPHFVLNQLASDRRADMILVDGDHSFEGTYWDLEVGLTALNPNGAKIMFVHDYVSISEVADAVNTWKKKYSNRIDFRSHKKKNGYVIIQVI